MPATPPILPRCLDSRAPFGKIKVAGLRGGYAGSELGCLAGGPLEKDYGDAARRLRLEPDNSAARLRLTAESLRRGEDLQGRLSAFCAGLHSKETRPAALESLRALGPVAAACAGEVIKSADESCELSQGTILSLGASTLPLLLSYSSSQRAAERFVAVSALSAFEERSPGLLQSRLEPEALIAILAERLADAELRVALKSAELLRRIGPNAKAALPALAQACRREDRDLRILSLLAMRRIGVQSELTPVLRRCLDDPERLVRFWACNLLAQLGREAEEARRELYALIIDRDAAVRRAARRALAAAEESGE
jgi:hypothetical protein